jgi:Protein of unknown function (DUF4242)
MVALKRSFVVECFWPGVGPVQVEQGATAARRHAEALTREGAQVAFTGSIFVPDDEVVFYLFDGVSTEAVREACTRAAIPFERVVESVRSA